MKRPQQAERVPRRMRRIKVRARNPTGRQRLVRRVCTAMRQQFGKHMGMRPGRALAAGRRDRLVNLDATEPADKDAMRIGRQDDFHGAARRTEYGLPGRDPQRRDDILIATAHVKIGMQGAETEIEQDAGTVFLAQRLAVGADFSERGASAHRALCFRQAERDAMAPAFGGGRFRGDRAKVRMPRNAQPAARRDHRHRAVVAGQHDWFVGVAHEFGERTERAQAPCDFAVRGLFGENFHQVGHHIVPWLRGVGLGGVVPALDATAGDAPLEGRPPTVSLTPPKMPKPGRRKPAGSSYCLLKRLSIRANNVTSSRRA
jgi:hypothetical protein